MRIGIDLDGVVIDSETTFRVYEELYDLIQYVAIATVCDVVDLVSENRILVKEGLLLTSISYQYQEIVT